MIDDIRGILLIIIDALRKDALDLMIEKNLSENLGRLKRKSIVFDNAYVLTNATDPSLTTILTGKHPLTHGLIHHATNVTEAEKKRVGKLVFLSEYLLRKGWFTAAVDFLGRWHRKGFLRYSRNEPQITMGIRYFLSSLVKDKLRTYSRDILRRPRRSLFANPYLSADIVSRKTVEYVNHALGRAKRFFIVTHYWSTHTPYLADKKHVEEVNKVLGDQGITVTGNKSLKEIVESAYDEGWRRHLQEWFNVMKYRYAHEVITSYYAAIKHVDESLGEIIGFLEDRGLLDKTLIIVTGDHGESLGEHNIYFDHHGLYQVSLRIPLIIYFEPLGKEIRRDTVTHMDITPTIVDLLNKKYPETVDGVPLIGHDIRERTIIAVETHTQNKIALIHEDYKIIESISREGAICRYCGTIHGGLRELYNLNRDPLETVNIYERGNNVVRRLSKMLSRHKLRFKTLLLKYKMM